jgi:aspartyl-tRNA(Asn)/glutamyl-tRNA(Gln) amidotransferase subunit A
MSGSLVFERRVPDVDAPVVRRLKAAGGVMLGKTTTPEFGWKAVGDSPLTGITRNPWNTDLTTGGSSAGAAAAAAAGLGPLHQGSDGAGSIRVPAAFCGVYGLKPSYGRVPYWPTPNNDHASHIGPITRTVADAALMLSVIAGTDDWDGTTLEGPQVDYVARLDAGVRGLRVAWSPTLVD